MNFENPEVHLILKCNLVLNGPKKSIREFYKWGATRSKEV